MSSPTGSRIADAVRKRRIELQWSQDRLAHEAGVSRKHVSSLERGIANVSAVIIDKVAKALRMPVIELGYARLQYASGEVIDVAEVRELAVTLHSLTGALVKAIDRGEDQPRRHDWFDQLRERVDQVHEAVATHAPEIDLRAVFQPLDEWIVGAVDDPADAILRGARNLLSTEPGQRADPLEVMGAEPRTIGVDDLSEVAGNRRAKKEYRKKRQRRP